MLLPILHLPLPVVALRLEWGLALVRRLRWMRLPILLMLAQGRVAGLLAEASEPGLRMGWEWALSLLKLGTQTGFRPEDPMLYFELSVNRTPKQAAARREMG